MPSRIRSACTEDGQQVTIKMAEARQYEELFCCSCGVRLSFVNGFFRQEGDVTITVQPFFRLFPNHEHSEDCAYNLHKQVEVIARESDPDVLERKSSRSYIFRLLIPRAAARKPAAADQKHGIGSGASDRKTTYIEATDRLGRYVNSAMRILALRIECERDAEIESVIRLEFEGKRIGWKDFYHEYGDYFRCYDKARRSKGQIPLAIRGAIWEVKVHPPQNPEFVVMNLVQKSRPADPSGVSDAASLSIYSRDLHAFDEYKDQKGQEILAFGWWETGPIKEELNKNPDHPVRVRRYHPLRLWPVLKSQVCLFSALD